MKPLWPSLPKSGIPATPAQYRCPICGKISVNHEDLKFHYANEHPDSVVPIVAFNVNGKDCEVLLSPIDSGVPPVSAGADGGKANATMEPVVLVPSSLTDPVLLHHTGCRM